MEERICAIYVRVSTDGQARKGYSLKQQETQCLRYLQLYYPENTNIRYYRDGGYSAKSLNRPQMNQLVEDIQHKKVQVVVAVKLDRLTRSVIDCYEFIQLVMKNDCSLVSVYDQLDISSANGRMVVGILAVFSQFERESISERTVNGYIGMARKGKYPFSKCPYGWIKDENMYLTIDPKAAEIVNEMGKMYIDGYSYEWISRAISRIYGVYISGTLVKKYLVREYNIGVFRYHDEIYKNIIPAIMDEKMYQQIIHATERRSIHEASRYGYIFHSLIICSCGEHAEHTCTIRHFKEYTKTYYYYYCPICKLKVNQQTLSKEIFPWLLKYLKQRNQEKELELIKRRIQRNEARILEVQSAYEEDSLTKDIYLSLIEKLTNKKIKLQRLYDSLQRKSIAKQLESMNEKELFDLVHQYIYRVTFDFENQKVTGIQFWDNILNKDTKNKKT